MGLKKNTKIKTVTDEKIVNETETENAVEEKPKAKIKLKAKKAPVLPSEVVDVESTVVEEVTEQLSETEISQQGREFVDTSTGEVIQANATPGTSIAEAGPTAVASYSPNQIGGGAMAVLAKEGFEGLEIGYGSFPILKLDGESFMLDDEVLKEKEIPMIISQSRSKFIIKEKAEETDNFIYSYDGIVDTKGVSVETFKALMKSKGNQIETKTYLEAVAEIVDGEFEGEFVLLSIPPSSLKRFSGYGVKVMHKFGVSPNKVVTQVSVGKKIVKDKKSWSPWKFTVLGLVEDLIED